MRAFLPQAESAEVPLDGEAVPMEKKHAHGLLLRPPRSRAAELPHRVHLWGGVIEIETTRIASRRFSPISNRTCTPRARTTRATTRSARTW